MEYDVVIPARNEEKYIEKTLQGLKRQSIPPNKIIVVNDGSFDLTSEIARRYADVVVDLPDRGYSALGTPEIPKVFNEGLKRVSPGTKYVLICGADAILPENFFEVIFSEMEKNPLMVIASGKLENDPAYEGLPPRGTRVVRVDFWREVNGLRYPESLGWESWLIFKALQLGKQVERIPYLITDAQRPPSKTGLKSAWSRGRGMRLLGYDWKYAMARAGTYLVKNPKSGVKMIAGYYSTKNKHKLDVADWVSTNQRKRFWKQVVLRLKYVFQGRRKPYYHFIR
jgi:glycosyltransferase involved in cell wall biosynthesis